MEIENILNIVCIINLSIFGLIIFYRILFFDEYLSLTVKKHKISKDKQQWVNNKWRDLSRSEQDELLLYSCMNPSSYKTHKNYELYIDYLFKKYNNE